MNTGSNRLSRLTKHVDKTSLGIEIAPFFNPAVPKSGGYNAVIVDLQAADGLRQRALQSNLIPSERVHEIEEVDIVGDASSIASLVKDSPFENSFAYIVSSHNFEHLPNPLKFLKGCSEVLEEGGILSMAIPDYRCCFDHFRFPTRLSDWMRAYREDISAPDADMVFDSMSLRARYKEAGEFHQSIGIEKSVPHGFVANRDLDPAYTAYARLLEPGADYIDVHCTVTFGAAFELMIRDLIYLGELEFDVVEITPTYGHEFFAHLRKTTSPVTDPDAFFARRDQLLSQIDRGLGPLGFDQVRKGIAGGGYLERGLSSFLSPRRLGRLLLGENRVAELRSWNRKRRKKRKGQ